MSVASEIKEILEQLPDGVRLIAVSKTQTDEAISEAYAAGQRAFGENRPQELRAKYDTLPKDIEWHMIGHLQTNKVKYIAPFVSMIQSVDSIRLLSVIDKEAQKNDRVIDILIELRIAGEVTKSGWDPEGFSLWVNDNEYKKYRNVRFRGLMSIASLTADEEQVRREFSFLHDEFGKYREIFGEHFDTLSMGMTSDYRLAIECGSNMVRIGSRIFGER